MRNKFLAFFAIVLVVVAFGLFLYINKKRGNEGSNRYTIEDSALVIVMDDNGFTPKESEVKKGGVVLFVNEDNDFRWPASDIHPTHELYPELDPKIPLDKGESWGIQLDRVGEWRIHDHLKPNLRGLIKVTE